MKLHKIGLKADLPVYTRYKEGIERGVSKPKQTCPNGAKNLEC